MLFKTLTIAALAAAAWAQGEIKITGGPSSVVAGKSYTFKFTGATGPATVILREGASSDLKTISTITESATGGEFTWNVPTSLKTDNDYALQISAAGSGTNFWAMSIAGGTAPASTSSSSSSSGSSSSGSKTSTSGSSTATVTKTSASSTATTTKNSTTVSKPTLSSHSSSRSSTSGSAASNTESAPSSESTGAAANYKSNAALVLGAVAAMAYLG